MEELLVTDQVVKRLNIGRSKVFELVRRKEIPVVRIGRALRFRASDLDAFIQRLAERER